MCSQAEKMGVSGEEGEWCHLCKVEHTVICQALQRTQHLLRAADKELVRRKKWAHSGGAVRWDVGAMKICVEIRRGGTKQHKHKGI